MPDPLGTRTRSPDRCGTAPQQLSLSFPLQFFTEAALAGSTLIALNTFVYEFFQQFADILHVLEFTLLKLSL